MIQVTIKLSSPGTADKMFRKAIDSKAGSSNVRDWLPVLKGGSNLIRNASGYSTNLKLTNDDRVICTMIAFSGSSSDGDHDDNSLPVCQCMKKEDKSQ